MPYVLVYEMRAGLKYFAQKKDGYHQLNGLVENAIKYDSLQEALRAKSRMEDILGRILRPEKVGDTLILTKPSPL